MASIKILDFTFDVDFTYNKASITKFEGKDSVLYLPNTLTLKNPQGNVVEVKVNKIGYRAFFQNKYLTKVIIRNKNKYTKIENEAFKECSSLKSFIHNDLDTDIKCTYGDHSFKSCPNLESIKLGNGVIALGGDTFSECNSLKEIDLPTTLTNLGLGAFSECRGIEYVNLKHIPITTTCDYTFFECNKLKKVELPPTLLEIGVGAFGYCYELDYINIPNSVKYFKRGCFIECKKLNLNSLPDSLEEIGSRVFYGCINLTNIVCNKLLYSIGEDAFYNCNLELVNLSSLVSTSIYSFRGSTIDKLVIENTANLYQGPIYNCNIKEVDILKLDTYNTTYYGDFINPQSTLIVHIPKELSTIDISKHNSLTTIYLDCSNYKYINENQYNILTLGNSNQLANKKIDLYVTNLKGWMLNRTVSTSITNNNMNIISNNGILYFREFLGYDEETQAPKYTTYKQLKDLTMNKEYNVYLYYNNLDLKKGYSIPFRNYKHLKTLRLDSCMRIPPRFFENCSNIEVIAINKLKFYQDDFDKSAVSLEDYVFNGCDNIKTIFYGESGYSWGNYFHSLSGEYNNNAKNGKMPVFKQTSKDNTNNLMYDEYISIPKGVTFTTNCFPRLGTLFSQPISGLTPYSKYRIALENNQGILSFYDFKTQLLPTYAKDKDSDTYKKGLVWVRTPYKEDGQIKYKYVQGVPWMRQEDNSYKVIESFG